MQLNLQDIIARWGDKLANCDGAISPTDAIRGAVEEALTGTADMVTLRARECRDSAGTLDSIGSFRRAAKLRDYADVFDVIASDIRSLFATLAPETNGGDHE